MVKIHAKYKKPAISIFFKMAELDKSISYFGTY